MRADTESRVKGMSDACRHDENHTCRYDGNPACRYAENPACRYAVNRDKGARRAKGKQRETKVHVWMVALMALMEPCYKHGQLVWNLESLDCHAIMGSVCSYGTHLFEGHELCPRGLVVMRISKLDDQLILECLPSLEKGRSTRLGRVIVVIVPIKEGFDPVVCDRTGFKVADSSVDLSLLGVGRSELEMKVAGF